MGLNKYKLGQLIELGTETNSELEYRVESVRGISINKIFIYTKANMKGVSLKPYSLVKTDSFAYVTVTSRNGEKISIAHNNTRECFIVSSSYVVFNVSRPDILLSDFLFIYFKRSEFDRYARFNSWGSAREVFSWDDMCDIDIELPSLPTQQKYVDIYKAMLANQKAYEMGLEDLKLVCDATIERIRRTVKSESILPYLEERKERNTDMLYTELTGVGNEGFITPRGKREESTFYKCNIFYHRDFVYNPSVISKGAIAFNMNYYTPRICTEEYIVFYVIDEEVLSSEYLLLWLKRDETGRFLDFINMDSVRNRVYFGDLKNVKIPIPDIYTQRIISEFFLAYNERKGVSDKLKAQIKDLCPILIKGH